MPRFAVVLILTLVVFPPVPAADAAPEAEEDPFAALRFRHLGPIGNRVSAVAGVPGVPGTYFAGAASGGIFRTLDGGVHWEPVFDDTPASSIGALAVAPSDPNVVWAGTGESFIRSNVSIGDGVYRSTDGGSTWEHAGLVESGRIGRIAIHPRKPDIVFAAALGHSYGPQRERGLYRTQDGGWNWEQVLFVDEDTGAIDVVIDPNNPRVVFAAMWEFEMRTSGRTSGGPGSGIWVSRDGGDNWKRLEGRGLPPSPLGKIGLAMSPDDSKRIYALIEVSSNRDFAPVDDEAGVLWRSDNGGRSWQLVNSDNTLTQRPLYYTRMAVAPDDADEVTFMAVEQSISHDGGHSIEPQNSGYDHHDIWIDPLDPDRRITGHDGGVSLTINRGESWFRPQLPIAQIYHVATDDRIPYNVYGNRQDGPSAMGPSNTLSFGPIPVGAWRTIGGCEVGFARPDPADPSLVWSGCYDGLLELHDLDNGHSRQVSVWPLAIESWAAADLDYRIQWTAPLAVSPHGPAVYYGSQYVHRSVDHGQSWEIVSPDLTTADPELMRRTGGLTLDDAGPTIAPVVFSIAESPLEPGVIWAGTNDGLVHISRDDGESWSDVTAGLDVPPLGTISNVEPSRHQTGRAYLTVDRHQEGDTSTWVFRTDDYGATWTSLRGDLPQNVFAYAHCVREDPQRPGMLYLGTENALWVSFDDGRSWRELGAGLPPAPVHWMEIQQRFDDLVVATYGRGIWVLDDLSALREWDRAIEAGEPRLFAPRAAFRFRRRAPEWQEYHNEAAGENPAPGATLHYWLPTGIGGEVAIRILDLEGREVRTLSGLDGGGGLHRQVWNLYEERTTEVRLRTPPDEASHVQLPDTGWRPLSDGGRFGVLAPPGDYELELRIDGEVVSTSRLRVARDPHSSGDEASLAEQQEVVRELREWIDEAASMINAIESARQQLGELRDRWQGVPDARWSEELESRAAGLEKDLRALEGRFFDLRLSGARQDTLRWPRLLYARLGYLARGIQQVDLAPTEAQYGVHRLLGERMADARLEWQRLRDESIVDFNEAAAAAGVRAIAPAPEE